MIMKKNFKVAAILLSVCIVMSSCIGSFSLTNKLKDWNMGIGNKFVNELVFVCMHIVPVYEISILADALVLNSIEFWTGNSALSKNVGDSKIVKNSKGEFVYNGTNETLVDCLSDVYTLMSNPKIFLNRQGTVGSTVEIPAILDHFAEGLTLFLIRPVDSLFGLKDRTDNLGIIPLPLYYEGQENYYSATNTWVAGTLCLPSYVGNAAKIVDSIQLLSMKAQEIVTPALYEVCLGQRLIHEPDSAKMLDIIFDNKTYDFGFTFNVGSIRNTIVKKGNAINTGASGIARELASLERVMTGWLTQFNTVVGRWE